MKSIPLVAALSLGALLNAGARTADAHLPLHRDMTVTGDGAVQQKRTELVWYKSRKDALRKDFGQSPYNLSLNGTWDFAFSQDDSDITGNASEWGTIKVPGNWELQGYDFPVYVNTIYDFATKDPQPPALPEAIPTGTYRRTFTVPASWAGNAVYLNVCGAKGGMYVYVNGKYIGYSEDAKDLARFDISGALAQGENEVKIVITKWSTGSYLECMDFWRISGIERDVYLSSEPAALKDFDFEVLSTLAGDMATGRFALICSGTSLPLSYEILDAKGKKVAGGALETDGGGQAKAELSIPDVKAWTAETPYLYRLVLRAGESLWTRFDVGFRRFDIVGNTFLVNGKPIKFKGVNLHEHDQYTGHYITRETALKDLELMRRHNINAIRTCHYPQPRFFYELCDSLGFYVYSEANVESHGMGYDLDRTLGNNPAWYPKHIDRIHNMYYRVRNYPCVTVLSLGNEGGNGCNFYDAYKDIKALEKDRMNRPVCYERAEFDWNTDCLVPQYPGADWFRKMGEEGSDRPVFPSEYAHAMGNSTGSLDLQWKYIYEYPNLQGGFIWDWVDQGLAAVCEDGGVYWKYGGDYGDRAPSDNNFLCNGIVGPDRVPHPGAAEVKHVYQEVTFSATGTPGVFRVSNRHYFKSLRGLKVRYAVYEDGKRVRCGTRRFRTPAQDSELFRIRLPRRMDDRKDYYVDFSVVTCRRSALLPRGYEVASDQILIHAAAPYAAPQGETAAVVDEGSRIVMTTSSARVVFDRGKAAVTEYSVGGVQMFDPEFGLRPNWWRAPNDNDYGCWWPARTQEYKISSKNLSCVANAGESSIHVRYNLASGNVQDVVYTLIGNVLKVDVAFAGCCAKPRPIEVPRIGFLFHEPASADAFSYYGRGPHENYWDRYTSAFVNRYESSASAEFVQYVRPQECGHHTDCRWLNVGPVRVEADRFEFTALRQSIDDLDSEESVSNDYQWRNLAADDVNDPAQARNNMRRQQHLCDIADRDFVEVSVDYRQTGVGGYDSWGATTESCRTLWSDRDYTFSFCLRPAE